MDDETRNILQKLLKGQEKMQLCIDGLTDDVGDIKKRVTNIEKRVTRLEGDVSKIKYDMSHFVK